MGTGGRKDPGIVSSFDVKFGSKLSGAFRECSITPQESEVSEYKFSGPKGEQGIVLIPGRLTWGRITLKRGITDDMSAWKWREEVIDGKVNEARTNGSILMMDEAGSTLGEFNFERCWPTKISGPQPNAASNDVAIEEIEIVYESMKRPK